MAEGQVIINDAGSRASSKPRTSSPISTKNENGSGTLLEMDELLQGDPHLISGATLSQVTVSGSNPVTKENPSDVKVVGTQPNKAVTLEVQNVTGGVQVTPSQALTEAEPNVPIYTTIDNYEIQQVWIDGQEYLESGGTTVTLAYNE
jgi:hypothetical protein